MAPREYERKNSNDHNTNNVVERAIRRYTAHLARQFPQHETQRVYSRRLQQHVRLVLNWKAHQDTPTFAAFWPRYQALVRQFVRRADPAAWFPVLIYTKGRYACEEMDYLERDATKYYMQCKKVDPKNRPQEGRSTLVAPKTKANSARKDKHDRASPQSPKTWTTTSFQMKESSPQKNTSKRNATDTWESSRPFHKQARRSMSAEQSSPPRKKRSILSSDDNGKSGSNHSFRVVGTHSKHHVDDNLAKRMVIGASQQSAAVVTPESPRKVYRSSMQLDELVAPVLVTKMLPKYPASSPQMSKKSIEPKPFTSKRVKEESMTEAILDLPPPVVYPPLLVAIKEEDITDRETLVQDDFIEFFKQHASSASDKCIVGSNNHNGKQNSAARASKPPDAATQLKHKMFVQNMAVADPKFLIKTRVKKEEEKPLASLSGIESVAEQAQAAFCKAWLPREVQEECGKLGYARFEGKEYPGLLVNPFDAQTDVARQFLQQVKAARENGKTGFGNRILYWLGTNLPEYSIIDASQFVSITDDQARHCKHMKEGVALLCKLKMGNATKAEADLAMGVKCAIKLSGLPPGDRFATLRKDFAVGNDFFFQAGDIFDIDKCGALVDANHEEYKGDAESNSMDVETGNEGSDSEFEMGSDPEDEDDEDYE